MPVRERTTTVPNRPDDGFSRRPSAAGGRPAGARFRDDAAPAARRRSHDRDSVPGAHAASGRPAYGRPASRASRPVPVASRSSYATSSARSRARRGRSRAGLAAAVFAVLALVIIAVFVFPAVKGVLAPGPSVEAGLEVEVSIPEGASGDTIASLLAEKHVIENPKDYYAAVTKLGAESSLKPGSYILLTLQDPEDVVRQLVDGPNADTLTLTIQEGLTVAQTAQRVEQTYGISADEFLAQAKASAYAADYPFLEGAYDDSLEGYLYPKTYNLGEAPTVDQIIRACLDQFQVETASLDLGAGPQGLTAQQVVTMASLIERETAVIDERPLVASVICNRLALDMPLQIDAAIVYARGGGSQGVSYADLEIDSPYNVYEHLGLTPGPICSPSISSIEAALAPAETDFLYYVASAAGDGSHRFTADYDEFERFSQEYSESLS